MRSGVAEFSFRFSMEGDRGDMFDAVRECDPSVDPSVVQVGKRQRGPLWSELTGTMDQETDESGFPVGEARGSVTVKDGETLAALIDAARKHKLAWRVEAMAKADGVNLYTYVSTRHWSNPGRVDGECHIDRKAMLGGVMGHVEKAMAALNAAVGRGEG